MSPQFEESVEPVKWEPIELQVDESPPDHRFASTDNYQSDLALLNYLLQDLRALVRQAAAGQSEISQHQIFRWTVHGLARRTVICDPVRLLTPGRVQIVGFFGNRRTDANVDMIEVEELKLIDEFRNYPGILSYSSVELTDDYWANLVVHSERDDREVWRHSHAHVYAAEQLAPRIYTDVRIHNGCLEGGPIGCETIVVGSTKYWDYEVSPVWHAIRHLPGGATDSIEMPVEN